MKELTGSEEDKEAQMDDMMLYISSCYTSEYNIQDNNTAGFDNGFDFL